MWLKIKKFFVNALDTLADAVEVLDFGDQDGSNCSCPDCGKFWTEPQ